MKKHVLGQSLIRRNPFYYDRSRRLLERAAERGLRAPARMVGEQVRRTLQLAQRTEYGASRAWRRRHLTAGRCSKRNACVTG